MKPFRELFLRYALLLGIGVSVLAHPAEADDFSAKYALIGSVVGKDQITLTHIGNLLRQHGIEVTMMGSIFYGVFVPHKQTEQAKRLLGEDALKGKYWLLLGKTHFAVPATVWRDYSINQKVRRLKSLPDKRVPSQIMAVLREPSLHKYPCLKSLHIRTRNYLADNGKQQTGYEGEVELTVSPSVKAAGIRQLFQVYDNGKRVALQGSTAWE